MRLGFFCFGVFCFVCFLLCSDMENCSDMKEMNKVWLSYPKQKNKQKTKNQIQGKYIVFPRANKKTNGGTSERMLFLEFNPKENLGLFAEAEKNGKPHVGNWMGQRRREQSPLRESTKLLGAVELVVIQMSTLFFNLWFYSGI